MNFGGKTLQIYFLLSGIFLPLMAIANDTPLFSERLTETEIRAQSFSNALKASQTTVLAAESQALSTKAPLFPRLTFGATYYYLTEVPSLNIESYLRVPNGQQIAFGSNSNYSIGPTLSYTLFDAGQARKNWHSYEANTLAREEDYKNNTRQLQLNSRLAYFRVQLSLKDLLLTSDSLKLSQAQFRDIDNRYRAGAASRLDALNSHRQVLSYQLRYRQAQNDLAAGIQNLFALTGGGNSYTTSRPVGAEMTDNLPPGVEEPTLLIRLDSIEETLASFHVQSFQEPNSNNPQIKSLAFSSRFSRLSSEALMAGLWPKIQLSMTTALEYPNGPIIERIVQNTMTVNASIPLFEADQTRNQSHQRMRESIATEYQREQSLTDLRRDWFKARDLLDSLQLQEKVSHQNVIEASEVVRLTFQSYLAGKVSYLDVQTANFQLLQARVDEAQIQNNILNEAANLDFLSSPGGTEHEE